MGVTITRTVRVDNTQKLRRNLRELQTNELRIGIFGSSGSKILIIANVNEYGANIKVTPKMRAYLHATGLHLKAKTTKIKIPERSFIRSGYDKNKSKIIDATNKDLYDLLEFRIEINQFWVRLGERLVGFAKEYLTRLKTPPNHPYTLEKKKPKKNPLINTGQLRQAITWQKVAK